MIIFSSAPSLNNFQYSLIDVKVFQINQINLRYMYLYLLSDFFPLLVQAVGVLHSVSSSDIMNSVTVPSCPALLAQWKGAIYQLQAISCNASLKKLRTGCISSITPHPETFH